ncbi:MAG TPA: surface-adhesin E family protein [Nitrospira sp.]|nr:surface-adhesin E family protein [Nitrospira sp.]
MRFFGQPLRTHVLLPLMFFGFLGVFEGLAYPGWEAVAISETGMTVYIDRTTIHRDLYVVTMSVLHDYQVPEHLSSGSFLSFTAQEQYDCGQARSRTINAVVFTEHMGNGAVLFSGRSDDTWHPVTPMSIKHALWQAACPEGKSTAVASLQH